MPNYRFTLRPGFSTFRNKIGLKANGDAVFDVPDGLICGNYSSGRIELTIKCGGGLSSTECCYIRHGGVVLGLRVGIDGADVGDRKSTRLNSSHT